MRSNPTVEHSTAILGAGLMGTAIAAAHLRQGLAVVLFDTSADALNSAPQRIEAELRLQDCVFEQHLLHVTSNLDDAVCSPILLETVTEKLRVKQRLYDKIEKAAKDGIPLLLSNTSTISISKLTENLSPNARKRFCGFHVFHPVRKNSLLEIIPGRETSTSTIQAARRHALRIDKQPITVGDGPGFLVNRILNPYLTEALRLLENGIDMQRIEQVATDFGMRMGPFRIMDEIGLDVVLHAGWVLYKAFPDRVPESALLLKLVELGRLGRKTGRGFMLYQNSTSWNGDGTPDPELPIESTSKTHCTTNNSALSDMEIERRLFDSMYSEALRCRDDGIITDLADADLASVHALGFPSEKGGIVHWKEKRSGE